MLGSRLAWRWEKQLFVDRHVLLDLLYANREAAVRASQRPAVRNLHTIVFPEIRVIDLGRIAPKRCFGIADEPQQQTVLLVEVETERRPRRRPCGNKLGANFRLGGHDNRLTARHFFTAVNPKFFVQTAKTRGKV